MNSDLLGCTVEIPNVNGPIRGRIRGIGMRPSDGEVRLVIELEDGKLRAVPADGAAVTPRTLPAQSRPYA
jgi:hypothetical protein